MSSQVRQHGRLHPQRTRRQGRQTLPAQPVRPRLTVDSVGSCNRCASHAVCQATGLLSVASRQDKAPLLRRAICPEHAPVFRAGDSFRGLYIVKSGSVKSTLNIGVRSEQIVNFRLPGEILDIGALGTGVHGVSATTLERTSLCFLPFEHPSELLRRTPDGLQWYLQLACADLLRTHETAWMLNKMGAKARVGWFLLDLSARFSRRGFSREEFNLRMSRHEIADHLCLSVETLSRQLASFMQKGLLAVDRRSIRLLDIEGLAATAGIFRAPQGRQTRPE